MSFGAETRSLIGRPGEIRTPVSGSRAEETSLNQAYFVVKDMDWVVSDFWQYCKFEECEEFVEVEDEAWVIRKI
ncbi:MAG: hypothetical protein ACE5I5_20785 [Candidatus Heimdallarchaeota archaeon]